MSHRIGLLVLMTLATTALLSSPVVASPPVGVTIVTKIDFSSEPFHGTFNVTEGADVLGCSRGTFTDFPAAGAIDKVMTCTKGGDGDIVLDFRPCVISFDPETNTCTGNWKVESATGDFEGLLGGGDVLVVFDPNKPAGMETLTGEIHYH